MKQYAKIWASLVARIGGSMYSMRREFGSLHDACSLHERMPRIRPHPGPVDMHESAVSAHADSVDALY